MHIKYFQILFKETVSCYLFSFIQVTREEYKMIQGFLTVEFDPDWTVRKQWGLY